MFFYSAANTKRHGTSLSLLCRFLFSRAPSGKCTLLLPNGMIKYRDFILQGKHVATANLSAGTTKVAIREYKNAIVPSNQLLS